jgi:ATP-dependent protease ClpP protease subunit
MVITTAAAAFGTINARLEAAIASDLKRDYYMSSEEAFAYGVIDRVITQR